MFARSQEELNNLVVGEDSGFENEAVMGDETAHLKRSASDSSDLSALMSNNI
jgi:hypothetical protein